MRKAPYVIFPQRQRKGAWLPFQCKQQCSHLLTSQNNATTINHVALFSFSLQQMSQQRTWTIPEVSLEPLQAHAVLSISKLGWRKTPGLHKALPPPLIAYGDKTWLQSCWADFLPLVSFSSQPVCGNICKQLLTSLGFFRNENEGVEEKGKAGEL